MPGQTPGELFQSTAVAFDFGRKLVDTYDVVLYIHLLSLLIGFSAGTIEAVCLLRLRAASTLEAAAPWGQLAGEIEKAFPVAIVGLFATGAYMTSDLWTWSTSWIVLSIVGLAVLSLQGPLVAGRRGQAVKAALMANGPGPLGPEAQHMTRDRALWTAAMTNLALVLGIIWVMVVKPGWGGAIAALVVGYAVGAVLAIRLTREPTVEVGPAAGTAGP
jgi:Na+/H+-dicarboxylate symporter